MTAGRPTMCTVEVADALIANVLEGVPITRAVGAAGIAVSTYYAWVERARAGEDPYVEFAERVALARDEVRARMVKVVTSAAFNGDVKAAQWYLERCDREHFGRNPETVVHVHPNTTAEAELAALTVEELEAELEALDRAAGHPCPS